VETLDLYYIHYPPKAQTIEALVDCLAEAIDGGSIRAAGVSNFDADQMRLAAARLEKRGHALAANEVEYSLSNREPEANGVLDACRELKDSLVAYRPLSRGTLASSSGADTLESIAKGRGATAGQVALAWLLQRDECIIPIPGATKRVHAEENMAALNLTLSRDELKELSEAAR
jgi:aryl-alcohol dehydrogenase-like predicted oxidoreductase